MCLSARLRCAVVVVYTKFGNGLLNEVSERWPQRAPRTVRYNRIDLYPDKTINFHKFKYFQFIIYILLSFYMYTHTCVYACEHKRAINEQCCGERCMRAFRFVSFQRRGGGSGGASVNFEL